MKDQVGWFQEPKASLFNHFRWSLQGFQVALSLFPLHSLQIRDILSDSGGARSVCLLLWEMTDSTGC